MKNINSINLEFANYSVQELELNELESIAGGSGLGYAFGWLYGATLGALVTLTNYMYEEQFGGNLPKAQMMS